jgi:hypothetical protein
VFQLNGPSGYWGLTTRGYESRWDYSPMTGTGHSHASVYKLESQRGRALRLVNLTAHLLHSDRDTVILIAQKAGLRDYDFFATGEMKKGRRY